MTEARSTDTWSRLRRALSALAAAHLLSASNFHSPTTKPGSARPEIKYVRFTFFLFLIRARPTKTRPTPTGCVLRGVLSARHRDARRRCTLRRSVLRWRRSRMTRPVGSAAYRQAEARHPSDRPATCRILPCTSLPPSGISPAPPGLVMRCQLQLADPKTNPTEQPNAQAHRRRQRHNSYFRDTARHSTARESPGLCDLLAAGRSDSISGFCLPPPLFANGRQARAITTTA